MARSAALRSAMSSNTQIVTWWCLADLIQSSVDRKFNPMEILSLDKVSFGLPIPNTGKLKMNAIGIRTDIRPGVMNIHIVYEFTKDA